MISTVFQVLHLICAGRPSEPQPLSKKEVLHAKEGLPFKSSCSVLCTTDNVRFMCAYLTRDVSTTEKKLNSLVDSNNCTDPCCCDSIEGGCAYCNIITTNMGDQVCVPFNRTITNIIVSSEDNHDYCSPLQSINFKSDSALLSDNGRFIVCAYSQDEFDLNFYSTVQLRVQRNYRLLKILPPVVGGVLVIVLVTTLTCVCARKRKRGHTSSSKLIHGCILLQYGPACLSSSLLTAFFSCRCTYHH